MVQGEKFSLDSSTELLKRPQKRLESELQVQRLKAEQDGILFGYTRKDSKSYPPGGRTYKSMNYHRQSSFKPGKTIWAAAVSVEAEAQLFDDSDFKGWLSNRGDLWWVSSNATDVVGKQGELVAFFPACENHPGPWHGYPVAPKYNDDYEIPTEVIIAWEEAGVVNGIVAKRMRRGNI